MARISLSRTAKRSKLRIGRSLLLVIIGLQLLAVWRFSHRQESPPRARASTSPVSLTQTTILDGNNVPAVGKPGKRWHRSSSLPGRMKDYFDWAEDQQKNLTPDNWDSQKYLVLQCLKSDAHCGGTSDRLKPIPLLVLFALQSKRLLMIRWDKPCPLEEFLLPPIDGYNWTVPSWLIPYMDSGNASTMKMFKDTHVESVMHRNVTFLRTRLQSFHGGSFYFEEKFNGTLSYNDVFHDLFRTFFEPTPPVAKIIHDEMYRMHLKPGEYSTAHYRVFYANKNPDESQIAYNTINAIECASELRPGGPVYFASDSKIAIKTAQDYAKTHSRPVVAIEGQEPLHLDKADSVNPEDYYSVFVDLYLLGMGRCTTFGMGGFGRYGLLLSYNATCWSMHIYNKKQLNCSWADAPTDSEAMTA